MAGRKKGHNSTTQRGHNAETPVEEIIGDLTPLDGAILAMLPDAGAKLGYHWLGPQVPTIKEILNKDLPAEQRVTGDSIAGRLASLEHLGLVKRVVVQPTQQGRGSQKTARGREALKLLDDE